MYTTCLTYVNVRKSIKYGVARFGHNDTTAKFNFNPIDHTGTIDQGKQVKLLDLASAQGCVSQDNVMPLKHAPRVIELVLVGNAADCLGTGYTNAVSPVVN